MYAAQRAAGHDLVRLGLLALGLRVVNRQGEPADVRIEVVPPEVTVGPHATDSAELLRIVRARLLEDGTILQAERLELVRQLRAILERLEQMTGR